MKIAILAWGSLYWKPDELKTTGEWFYDGPVLPIEFARISKTTKNLTLVIGSAFERVITLYAISSLPTLEEARLNLQKRERSPTIENIGFIDFTTNTSHVRPSNSFILPTLKEWNVAKKFDAIIWSDFGISFKKEMGKPLSANAAIEYLETKLSPTEKDKALEYIKKAPEQITTRFRASIEKHFEGQFPEN